MPNWSIEQKHSADAVRYAQSAVNGEIVAGHLVIQACKRFLSDLDRDDIFYDEKAAEKACNFIELLPHTKGKWAAKKETLILQAWQRFIICNLFGWKLSEGGPRRFRTAFNLIARKNGKSALGAGIGNFCFCADNEFGAEIYSGATTEKQAWEVFRPAKLMVERTPELKQFYDIDVNAKNMCILSNGSRFEPLIGKPGDGSSPSLAIVDEYHEHDSDELYQTMETGMGAREQPLMLVISTAGSNLSGPCHEMQRDVERLLNGEFEDDSLFGIIFSADEDDEWDSDDALLKANPNIDISVSGDFLRAQRDQARRSASKQNHFRTKHLNQWVGAKTAWMNMLAWQRQSKPNKFEQFKSAPCHMAIDLASRKDVAVINLLFKQGSEFYTKSWFYAPESAAEENDKYQNFALSGELILTDGNKTDQALIEEQIKILCSDFDVRSIAFDDWQADYMMTRLMDCGLPVVNYNQTIKNMSTPMKEVEAVILDGNLYHDGNRCMTWMMGNVVSRVDAKDNIYPRKENDNDKRCKIDGPVALIMAKGRWLSEETGGFDDFLSNPVAL